MERYCRGCKTAHASEHWYGGDKFYFCTGAYSRLFRQGYEVCHPSWPQYEDSLWQTDATSARICAAVYRKDVQAMRDGRILLMHSKLTSRMRLLVSLLGSTYYFDYGSQSFIEGIVRLQCKEPTKAAILRVGRGVYFKGFGIHL